MLPAVAKIVFVHKGHAVAVAEVEQLHFGFIEPTRLAFELGGGDLDQIAYRSPPIVN
jgi:hypothetical protein